MRKVYIVVVLSIFTLISSSVIGQRKYLDIADEQFELRKYREAIDYYELALEENFVVDRFYILQQIARTSHRLFDYEKAIEYYKILTEYKERNSSENLYNYAQVLRSEQKYEEARLIFNDYTKRQDAKSDSIYFNKLIDYCINYKEDEFVGKIDQTNINTGNRNLGISFNSKGLLISVPENKKYDDKTTYYDLATVDSITSTSFESPNELSKKFNGPYYEGTPFIYDNGTKILFSSNSADLKRYKPKKIKEIAISEDGRNILKIYSAQLIDNKWTEPVELGFNGNNYNCTFPNLSEDGSTLYFSSDKEGGFGGYDLWKVNKIDESTWSSPKNLGATINTFEDEIYPYNKKDKLYFSSKGHLGIGGYDIFVSNYINNRYTQPLNIGKPINSSRDDFSFILDSTSGYFSTNRKSTSNLGYDMVYYFNGYITSERINGVVSNQNSGELLAEVLVKIYKKDATGKWLLQKEIETNDKGEYSINLENNKEYKINFQQEGFEQLEYIIPAANGDARETLKEKIKNVGLKKKSNKISGFVVDSITGKPVSGIKVSLKNKSDSLLNKYTYTGQNGEWDFDIDPLVLNELTFEHQDLDFEPQTFTLDGYTGGNYGKRNKQLEEISEVKLKQSSKLPLLKVLNKLTGNPLPGVDIIVLKKDNNDWVEVNTFKSNEDGVWNLGDLIDLETYKVSFTKIGFDTEFFELPSVDYNKDRKARELALLNVFLNPSKNKGNVIQVNNIYFDFSHSRPKKESYPILDNIVMFMNENITIKVELSAHTDAVGKNDFNQDLSEKRAARCTDYLVRHGIERDRIISKGYGESKILNGCIEWDQCSEEKNQINRRVEIKIL